MIDKLKKENDKIRENIIIQLMSFRNKLRINNEKRTNKDLDRYFKEGR